MRIGEAREEKKSGYTSKMRQVDEVLSLRAVELPVMETPNLDTCSVDFHNMNWCVLCYRGQCSLMLNSYRKCTWSSSRDEDMIN